jgi:DNA primase
MDAKDEVKSRLSVEDVVGQYLELKKAGRNFKALSPFTNEKTPSFVVSPEKQIWHDFSSNKGGDIFSFVMEMEGVDFKEALNILARKAGVEVKQYGDGGKTASLKKRIYEILEIATKYYQQTLVKNKDALEYVVNNRGFNKKTIQDFQIGYAPNAPDALVKFLKNKGFEPGEIKAAGLTSSRGGDMFRGRIMVPLADREGRVIGFTARILQDTPRAPKYINTPQTLVYDKSRHVFGLHLAKETIRRAGYSVLTEGNLDVVSSHQVKVTNVVAAAGTALTQQQMKTLGRLAEEVRLAFDQDEAGVRATERAIEISQGLGVNLYVIDIPEGKDPDELIQKDPELWKKAISAKKYALDWLLERHLSLHDTSTAKGKREMTTAFMKILGNLEDTVEQDHYVGELAKATDTSYDAVKSKLNAAAKQANRPSPKKNVRDELKKAGSDAYAYQDNLLALCLYYPDTRVSLDKVEDSHIEGSERSELLKLVRSLGKQPFRSKQQELHSLDNYVKILALKAQELYGDWSSSDRTVEAIGLARRVRNDQTQKQRKELTERIRILEERVESEQAKKLLEQYSDMLKGSNN